MRDAPNVELRCKNWANEDPKKRRLSFETAGTWPWKLESSK